MQQGRLRPQGRAQSHHSPPYLTRPHLTISRPSSHRNRGRRCPRARLPTLHPTAWTISRKPSLLCPNLESSSRRTKQPSRPSLTAMEIEVYLDCPTVLWMSTHRLPSAKRAQVPNRLSQTSLLSLHYLPSQCPSHPLSPAYHPHLRDPPTSKGSITRTRHQMPGSRSTSSVQRVPQTSRRFLEMHLILTSPHRWRLERSTEIYRHRRQASDRLDRLQPCAVLRQTGRFTMSVHPRQTFLQSNPPCLSRPPLRLLSPLQHRQLRPQDLRRWNCRQNQSSHSPMPWSQRC